MNLRIEVETSDGSQYVILSYAEGGHDCAASLEEKADWRWALGTVYPFLHYAGVQDVEAFLLCACATVCRAGTGAEQVTTWNNVPIPVTLTISVVEASHAK